MNTTTDQAKPAKETIKQIAECEHCWLMIEKTKISQGWYHCDTGNREC